MTENLRLVLDSSKTLTAQDTDLNSKSTWKPVRNTQTANGVKWVSASGTTWAIASQATEAEVNAERSYNGLGSNGVNYVETYEKQLIGTLYNWHTATAASGNYSMTTADTPDSVCPYGWMLPNKDSWTTMLSNYDVFTKSQTVYGEAFTNFPLSYTYSGGYFAASAIAREQTTHGNLWTKTANTNTNAVALNYSNGYTTSVLTSNAPKANGAAVRCVAK